MKIILFYIILLVISVAIVIIVIWLDKKDDYWDDYEMLKPMNWERKQKLVKAEYINGDKMYKHVYEDAYRDGYGHLHCDRIYTYDLEYREEGVEPTTRKQLPTNCKNCGAPLHSHECEYCGSEYY